MALDFGIGWLLILLTYSHAQTLRYNTFNDDLAVTLMKRSADIDECAKKDVGFEVSVLDMEEAKSFQACKEICTANQPDCLAFTFADDIQQCMMYDEYPEKQSSTAMLAPLSATSAIMSCYEEKGDSEEDDECMKDSLKIWGSGSAMMGYIDQQVSSYYDCKKSCKSFRNCVAFTLYKKEHRCLFYRDGFSLDTDTHNNNWSSGTIECYKNKGEDVDEYCEDEEYPEICEQYSFLCTTNMAMRDSCKKTCGECGDNKGTEDSSKPDDIKCEDTNEETCAMLADLCEDFEVQRGCAATCGLCNGS